MSELTSVRIIVSDPWTIERPPHRGLKKIRILGLVQIRLQLWLINVGFYFVVFARIRKVGLFWNVCDFIENCFSVTWMDDWLCFGLGLEILDVVSGWSWKLWGLLLNGINEGFFFRDIQWLGSRLLFGCVQFFLFNFVDVNIFLLNKVTLNSVTWSGYVGYLIHGSNVGYVHETCL